jgi:hypothetical protein
MVPLLIDRNEGRQEKTARVYGLCRMREFDRTVIRKEDFIYI